jgi:hypothetical protein
MRYRMMATYRGVPYEAGVGPSGSDVVLFAACPPPEELGFEPAPGHWRKRVIRAEVDALWESRPVGTFRGEPCIVLDDLGDRLHIAYLGHDPEGAARLGYWQVDRGVFELLTPREDVTGLTEERVDKPLTLAQPRPGSATGPGYPYGQAAADYPDPLASLPGSLVPGGPLAGASFPGSLADSGPLPPVPPLAGYPESGFPAPATTTSPGLPATTHPGLPATTDSGRPTTTAPGMPAVPSLGLPAVGSVPAAPAGPPPAPSPPRAAASSTAGKRTPEGGGGRAARRQRVRTREIFSELADLAAIPRAEYALEAEVDGALCLLQTAEGFEVFVSVDGARHEARSFADEEAAYFYLFGVLAADAIRNGLLVPAASPATARAGLL